MKTSLKASLIAAAIATLPFGAQAAGLGQINVFSGLGQPLRAEVQLNASAQELQSITARVASPDSFRQANVPYSAVMTQLKLSVEQRGGRPVIRITSDRPVNEPFVDLLVELNWAAGRLIREYTFLLDPVDVGAAQPMAARPAATRADAAAVAAPAGAGAGAADSYTVKRGDTLREIAESHRSGEATLDQMLVALFRDNRAAFDGANMNRLRAGAVLSIPAAAGVAAVDEAQAHHEVVAHAADFNAYRQRLAAAVAQQPAKQSAEAEQASAGRVVPKVAETTPEQPQGDQVRVSRTQDGKGATGDQSDRLHSLEEDLVARDQALAEAESRVKALEENVRELQRLIELKSQNLAQLQQQAGGAPAAGATAARATAAPSAEAAPAAVAETKPQSAASAPKPAAAKAAPAKPAPAAAAPVEPGFLETLLQDPTLLGGAAGIVVLLLAYAGYKARARRKAAGGDESAAAASVLPPDTASVFGGTGGQTVDTSNSSVIHTDFSQSGMSSIDADEGVDPVAEADVYMAYGRDAQAEEILLDARKADPGRAAIHLKLLEIYAQRKDLKQFETTATEFYSRTGGAGAEWDKAAAMGRKLDPENPLYRAGASAAEPVTEPGPEAWAGAAAAAVAQATATNADDPAAAPALVDLDFASLAAVGAQEPGTDAVGPGELAAIALPTEDSPEVEAAPLPTIDATALDFDLDLDAAPPSAGDAPAPLQFSRPPETVSPMADSAGAAGDLMLDLDLDGDRPDEPAAADSLTATALQGGLGAAPADEGLDFDLSMFEPAVAAQASQTVDLSATALQQEAPDEVADAPAASPIDANLLDFDLDLGNIEQTVVRPEPPAADFDLDLDPIVAADPEATGGLAAAAGLSAVASSDAASEEVDTKLELARAYEEMGDKEGARELLEEVLAEGSAEQQGAARSLIQRLA